MSRETDWYAEIIQVYGTPQRGAKVAFAYAETFRDRLPDFLLRF